MDINIEKYHLKSTSLFDLLSKEEVQLIKSKIIIIDYIKGTLLFAEDSYSRGIYIVKKERLKFLKPVAKAKTVLFIFTKKEIFLVIDHYLRANLIRFQRWQWIM